MDKLREDILGLLGEDSRLGAARIAKMLGADEKQVAAAIKEMEESGVIIKYTVITDDELADKDTVEALIEVKVSPMYKHGFDAIAEEIYQFDEVKTLYLMSGAYDLAVIVESASLKAVSRFVSECISTYESVISTATHFILKKYKVEGALMQDEEGGRLSIQP